MRAPRERNDDGGGGGGIILMVAPEIRAGMQPLSA